MARPEIRFVILGGDNEVIRDKVEGVNFRVLDWQQAKKLCEQLESMHNTIGALLEELDKLKFPNNRAQLNTDFDAQELLGEPESEHPADSGRTNG